MSQYVSIMGLNERKELAKNLECKIGGWGQMLSGKRFNQLRQNPREINNFISTCYFEGFLGA